MLNFLRLSKRKKIKAVDVVDIYCNYLNEAIENGFVEIKDFINQNNNLESAPNIQSNDIKWFRLIVLLHNLSNLKSYFEDNEVIVLRSLVLDQFLHFLNNNYDLAMEQFLDHEEYFTQLINQHQDSSKAMAFGIFQKYNINEFQGELFKRKKEPNPVFLHELRGLLKHFTWNWKDYLKKYRINF